MSMVSTPIASGSGSTQELMYTLQVLRAELAEAIQKKSVVYVEIKLPKKLQVLTHTVELPNLEWTKKLDFTSQHTTPIQFKLKKRRRCRSDMCLGEESITVGELNARCQGGQDYSLVLVHPQSRQSVGTLLLQLQIKAKTPRISPDLTGPRQMVENMRSKIVDTLSVEYPDKSRFPSTCKNTLSGTGGIEDPAGFEILNRVRNQLESMKSGKLRTTLGVINAAAKIHPCVESSWEIVSLLHGAYQKKPRIDSEVIGVFTSMDHVLSFVENVDRLKDNEQWFCDLIEQSLRVIEDCGPFILKYLNGNARDRTQSALSNSSEERLRYYQKQLNLLAENLARIVNVHVAHRVEDNHEAAKALTHHVKDNHNEVMEALERIDKKTPNSQPSSSTSFQSIIPPPPTDMFTGRGDYLKKIKDSFGLSKTSVEMGTQRKFVLYGTGGIGKTQLALKFLDENRERFTMRYIIDASSHESIAASFANIGRDAGIPDADTHKVLDWLSKKIEDWILIFDNADNRDVKLRPYFPNSRHGNILITTRNADYGSLAPSLEVSVLNESSAVVLLQRTAQLDETEENREMARKIVGEFGHLALAIVQAGSYIHTEQLTLNEYYDRYECSRSSLLKSGPLKEELAYERPVYATWEISYAALSQFAKTMLDLCAFLYREGITEELWLRAIVSDKTKREMESKDDDPTAPKELLSLVRHLDEDKDGSCVIRFREIIRELRSYSLIQEPFKGSFSIHPLVHSWARERMKSSHRSEAQANAMHLLYYSLGPTVSEVYLDSCFTRTIIPHIEACGQPLYAHIALEFTGVYAASGRENDPQTQRLLTIEVIKSKQFEAGNPNTYRSRRYLGELYRWLDRYPEAAEILRTLVEEKTRILGNGHSATLNSMHELALTYRDQGRLDDSRDLFVKVIEAQKRILGNEHSSTLFSMHELALTYRDQGRLDDSRDLFVKVIEGQKRVLGNEHSSTLFSMHELALTYRDQGRLGDAQQLFVRVIEAEKRVLGNDHSSTLLGMYYLGLTYRDQGQLDDAQELFVEVIEAEKRVLGKDNSLTLDSMHCLALTYQEQGRLGDAQELFAEAVEVEKRVLGIGHSSTLESMQCLALTYRDQGRLDEAQRLFVEIIEAEKRVLDDDHSSTLLSMYYLALVYRDQGQLDDAQHLFAEVIEGQRRAFGNEHPSTLVSMHQLALTFRKQGRLDDAQCLFTEAIESGKRVLGNDHSSTLDSMHELALTYRDQGRLDDAQELFANVMEAKKRVLGNDCSSTLASMYELASTYLNQNYLADAEELGVDVYELHKHVFGLSDCRTVLTRDILIKVYTQQGRLGDAGRLKALNSNHP